MSTVLHGQPYKERYHGSCLETPFTDT